MKRFLAIYIGTEAALARSGWNDMDEEQRRRRDAAGVEAWEQWAAAHADAIVDQGSPLGKRSARTRRESRTSRTA